MGYQDQDRRGWDADSDVRGRGRDGTVRSAWSEVNYTSPRPARNSELVYEVGGCDELLFEIRSSGVRSR